MWAGLLESAGRKVSSISYLCVDREAVTGEDWGDPAWSAVSQEHCLPCKAIFLLPVLPGRCIHLVNHAKSLMPCINSKPTAQHQQALGNGRWQPGRVGAHSQDKALVEPEHVNFLVTAQSSPRVVHPSPGPWMGLSRNQWQTWAWFSVPWSWGWGGATMEGEGCASFLGLDRP